MKIMIFKASILCLCLFGCLQPVSGQDTQQDGRLYIPSDAKHRTLLRSEDISLFDKGIYMDAYGRFWMTKDSVMLCADFSDDSSHLEFLRMPSEIKNLKGLLWLTPEILIVTDKNTLKIFQDSVFYTLSQLPYNDMNLERASDSTFYVFGKTDKKTVSYELYYCSNNGGWLKLGDFKDKINAVCGDGIMTLAAIGKKIYVFDHITGTHVLYSGEENILSLATTWNGNLFFSTTTSIVYNDDLKDVIKFSNMGASKIWSYGDNLYVLYLNNVLVQISPVSSFNNFSRKMDQTIKQLTDTIRNTNAVSLADTVPSASFSDSNAAITTQPANIVQPVSVISSDSVALPTSVPKPVVTNAAITTQPANIVQPVSVISSDSVVLPVSVPKPVVTVEPPVIKPATTQEELPVKTQPQQPKTSEQLSDRMEAIDYVTEIKGLVDLFQTKQRDFSTIVLEWNKQVEAILNEIDRTNAAIEQTEKKLDDTKNSAATGVTQQINALKNTLTQQRDMLRHLRQKQTNRGMEIIGQLKKIAKRDAGDMNRKFGETGKKITSSATFPALNEKRTTILFSEEIEKLPISDYLKATNELRFWYKNVEKSFPKIIDKRNQRAQSFIDEDDKLLIQLQALQKQLSEYQQEPKIRKKEIKDVKKKIVDVEKDRKNISKQMKKEADDFAAYLKGYNKEIQTEYKTRIQNVSEEINYSFQQNL
jgi:predicted  nucleic acid-binding Zn-ribbon protein